MTLIFDRSGDIAGKKMHALVIGAGRFPHFGDGKNANVQSCYDSAVAIIDFLLDHKDRLEPQLATIDCLLGNPSVDPDQASDTMPAREQHGIAHDVDVARPIEAEVKGIFDDFISRFEPGDSAFLYFCSHGVVGREEVGLLVLEDINSRAGSPWAQILDVKFAAQNLPARLEAESVWLFMDACQERIPELAEQVGGAKGIDAFSVQTRDLVNYRAKSLALAAGRFGNTTYAPEEGGVAHFTQALLDGLTYCCVDRRGGEWRISSKQLQWELETVARAAGYPSIEVTQLVGSGQPRFLMTVDEPSIPVHVFSRPESLLRQASNAQAKDLFGHSTFTKTGPDWRFRAPPSPDQYQLEIAVGEKTLTAPLEINPPAVEWEIGNE
ncbi:MAG: hypothetical protein ABGW84_02895 [Sphingomonadaceae bacterium]